MGLHHRAAGRSASVLVVGAALALCATLAGCTADEGDARATPSAAAPAPAPSPACVVGTWEAGAEELQRAYDLIPAGLDYPAAAVGADASATLVLGADGAFSFTQDVPTTLTWLGHPAAVRLGGTMAGTYVASGEALTLTASDNDLVATAADDRTASSLFAAATQDTLAEWPVSASSFRCDGDELVLGLVTEGHAASVGFSRR